jgi:predicted transcriptional regulator
MNEEATSLNTVDLAVELTIAWLSNPNTRPTSDEVPGILQKMYAAVSSLGPDAGASDGSDTEETFTPAVTARKSLASPDHIISMIDGRPYRTLKRHLSGHGLTPEQYRERYKLKADYPMVAPGYSEQRSAMAKKIGLGRKPGQPPTKKA